VNTNRFRSLIAWSFGIISSILLFWALAKMSSEIGLKFHVDSDELITWDRDRGSYTNDSEGYFTPLGKWTIIISITVGARLGMALFAKRWDGGSEKKDKLSLSLFMIGVTAYAALLTALWKAIPSIILEYEAVRSVSEIAVVAGLYWLLSRNYRDKCFEWDQEEKNQPFLHNALPVQNGGVRSSPMGDKIISVLPKPNAVHSPSQIENEPIRILPRQNAVLTASPEDNIVVSISLKEAHIEEDDKVDLDFLNSLIAKSTEMSSAQAPFVLKEEKPLKKSKSGGKNKRKQKLANQKSKPRRQAKHLETETKLYVVQTPFSEPNGNVVIKIGESTNIEERIKTFKFYWRDKFKILALAPGKVKDEAELHKFLLSKHIGGEYFSVEPKQIPATSPQMSKKALLNWLGEILYED
jgi:hypothetical protein